MLKYSEAAEDAVALLFQNLQDITLFVEDTTNLNYYHVLIQRLFDGKLRIRRLFPRGGRLGVIAAALDVNLSNLKNAVFIIDGDAYLLSGQPSSIPSKVIALDVYCFENYLFCPQAAFDIARECEPKISFSELNKRLNIGHWQSRVVKRLQPLFEWYAVACELKASIQTVSRSGLSMVNAGESVPSPEKVKDRIAEIRQHLIANYGKRVVYASKRRIHAATKNFATPETYISGKTYLIPLLARHLSLYSSFRDSSALPVRLTHRFEVGRAEHLRREIVRRIALR